MSHPPYLVSLAMRAALSRPRQWQDIINVVTKRQISSLPQSSIGLLHDALATSLDRERAFKNKTSEELLAEFQKRTNEHFGAEVLRADDTLRFVLRLGCVLLRMGKLDKDPSIARAIVDTGCLRRLGGKSELNPVDLAEATLIFRNAPRMQNGTLRANSPLLTRLRVLFLQTPSSEMPLLRELAKAVLASLVQIYDAEFLRWSPKKATTLPAELLLLVEDRRAFEASPLFQTVQAAIGTSQTRNLNLRNLPRMIALNKTNLISILPHVQALLSFYQSGQTTRMANLKKHLSILRIFQTRVSRNLNVLNGRTSELGATLRQKKSDTDPFYAHYTMMAKMAQAEKEKFQK